MKRVPAINPALVHRFYRDHSPAELELIQQMLGYVPDHDPSAAKALFEKFKQDKATVLERRDDAGKIVGFIFFELRDYAHGARDFSVLATLFMTEQSFREADLAFVENAARQLGCTSLSLMTSRIGLVDFVTQHGWFVSEITCRKGLKA